MTPFTFQTVRRIVIEQGGAQRLGELAGTLVTSGAPGRKALVVTDAFLAFSLEQGNDLTTPKPEWRFAGLKAGDRWCLCALRWKEALRAGVAPPVVLAACHERALAYVTLAELQAHAWAAN